MIKAPRDPAISKRIKEIENNATQIVRIDLRLWKRKSSSVTDNIGS